MLESKIQSSIIKQLEKEGWYCIKIMKSNKNGVPDVLALRNKEAVFYEVKQPGSKPTALQLFRHEELRKQGFAVKVITDKKEI